MEGARMQLKDKVIIVTGSTTGIGEAIARRCVAEGARVLIHGTRRDAGEQVASSLGSAASLYIDDLSDAGAAPRLIASALTAFGKIDGLVNNAAWLVRSNIHTTNAELFDRAMAINVRAPLLLIQAALKSMEATQGSVLNIGSINAYTGEANQLAYSISKGALMTLSRNLADALGRQGVRVNHFNVGWVLTANEYKLKISEGLDPHWSEHIPAAFAPSGHILSPEHIAGAAVYWLSDESRPISGSVLDLEQYPVIGRNPLKENK
jgi:NAD(P)-dependent dehydrogenase (short-subunit alcohol dehydrogenase family)